MKKPFDQLRHCYMENERTNRVKHESGYHRVVQITIIGRGAGTFTIRFNENGMQVDLHLPTTRKPTCIAASITCSPWRAAS